jgi:ComEC/Rec2-related protein
MKKERKFFNYRFYAAAALALMAGIASAIFLDLILTVVLGIGLIILFGRRRAFVVFFIIGAAYVPLIEAVYAKKNAGAESAKIEGVIDSLVEYDGARYGFDIKNLVVDGEKYDGKARVQMSGGVSFVGELKQGNEVRFVGSIAKRELNPRYSFGLYLYNKEIYYQASALSDVAAEIPKFGGAPVFRQKIFEGLSKYLSEDSAGVSYALIFGDNREMPDDLVDAYKNTGLTHVFAVSGLHFAFLFSLLTLIFKLKIIKLKRSTKDIIVFVIFLAFAYACGFSASVMRSVVMITVYMYAQTAGRKNDGLNSLCFAATVVLLFNPFFLLDLGFLLSFTAVLGLILFSGTFGKAFSAVENKIMPKIFKGYLEPNKNLADKNVGNISNKSIVNISDINFKTASVNRQANIGMPNKNVGNVSGDSQDAPKTSRSVKIARKLVGLVKDSLAMTFSANIGVFPILCIYFGAVPMISLATNIFVVPTVSILFPYLLVVGILGAFIPFFNVFFLPSQFVIGLINEFVYFFSKTPFFITDGIFKIWTDVFGANSLFWFAAVYYVFLIYISKIYIGPKLNLMKRLFKREKKS